MKATHHDNTILLQHQHDPLVFAQFPWYYVWIPSHTADPTLLKEKDLMLFLPEQNHMMGWHVNIVFYLYITDKNVFAKFIPLKADCDEPHSNYMFKRFINLTETIKESGNLSRILSSRSSKHRKTISLWACTALGCVCKIFPIASKPRYFKFWSESSISTPNFCTQSCKVQEFKKQ